MSILNSLMARTRSMIQHYDHRKYWRLRKKITSGQGNKLLRLFWLYRVKYMDAKNCASMGTNLDKSAVFASPPILPHGLYGIIVSHEAVIGENVTIFHQVTIGRNHGAAPIIGNNVMIGAGAKIIGGVKIGNNAKIGANCVVCTDVPDNCTVVLPKPRIILKE